jgi:hypothetical protein
MVVAWDGSAKWYGTGICTGATWKVFMGGAEGGTLYEGGTSAI